MASGDAEKRFLRGARSMDPGYTPGSRPNGSIVVQGGRSYMVVDGGALIRVDKNRAKNRAQRNKKDK